MATAFYVSSFVQILHYVSDDLLQCDASTSIGELFSDEFDDLDFELALTCFEATHKVAFKESFWKTDIDDLEELTLEEFIETQVDAREQKDPLFVTKRFLFYEKSLTDALREEYEGPSSTEE
jgi:hypothetical protein